MKKLLALLLCIVLLSGCAATYDGPTESRSLLSRIQTVYSDAEEPRYQQTDYSYDIYGNLSVIQAYRIHDSEGSWTDPYLKTVRTYDENGNCIRQRQYDVSGWLPKKLVDVRYTYDDLGRMTSATHSKDLSWDNFTVVYDDEARTQTTAYADSTQIDHLDEQGRIVRTEITTESGEHTLRTYAYDDQGRILSTTQTAGGAEAVTRYEYGENYQIRYDPDGTHTTTTYNPDGSIHYICHADSSGLVIQDWMYYYSEIQVPIREEDAS